jgi:Sec-independent protein secretion pathway component TatC
LLSPLLSIVAYVLAAGALVFPLPLGLAAAMLGVVATVAAKGRRRWTMMAAIAIAAGVAGTAAGLWIGMAITKP